MAEDHTTSCAAHWLSRLRSDASTKGALETLARALALELARHGIHISGILP
ncbi:MAG: hypothetical protein M5U01_28955 [Ardenticatenaceae bacterium]|nr:hypothetical protein [Ardenticatenaceae bacterium]